MPSISMPATLTLVSLARAVSRLSKVKTSLGRLLAITLSHSVFSPRGIRPKLGEENGGQVERCQIVETTKSGVTGGKAQLISYRSLHCRAPITSWCSNPCIRLVVPPPAARHAPARYQHADVS